jgi:transcriptional regulator with XRE-family HTH domain
MPRLKKPDLLARAIGGRVLELLAERKLTQERLAFENGVPKATITNLIKGRARPSIVTLKKIAVGLNVELLDLFTEPADSDRHRLIDRTRGMPVTTLRRLLLAVGDKPGSRRSPVE